MEGLSSHLIMCDSDLLHRLSALPSDIRNTIGIRADRNIHRVLHFNRPAGNSPVGSVRKNIQMTYVNYDCSNT